MNRNRMLKTAAIVTAASIAVTSVGFYEFRSTETNVTADTSKVQQKIEEAINNTINSTTTFGADKEETVYVISDASGNVQKKIVSDWLKNKDGKDTITDKTDLKNVENVKGDETYTGGNQGNIEWKANGSDIYYQGTTDKELPVNVKVTYYLDGKEMSPEDMAGKSGQVKIRFEYENTAKHTVKINGKDTEMYTPFTMLTGMILPADKFTDVEVSDGSGKIVSDGNNEMVLGVSFSGLKEDLENAKGKDKVNIDISDSFEITANVNDFSLAMTLTVGTSDVFSGIDVDSLDSIDDVEDTIDELVDAVGKLADGSNTLKDGLGTLRSGASQVNDGVTTLNSKTGEFVDGLKKVDDGVALIVSKMSAEDGAIAGADALAKGVATIDQKMNDVQGAVGQLADGAGTLDKGAGDVSKAVGQLAEGSSTLDKSVGTLASGATQLATGASTIDGTVGKLQSGAKELATGASTIDENLGKVETGVTALADGAGAVSNGVSALANGIKGTEESTGLSQAADSTAQGVDALAAGAGQLESGVDTLQNSMVDTLKAQIEKNESDIATYKTMIAQLTAAGDPNGQIPQLTAGIAGLTGANQALEGVIQSLTETSGDATAPSAYDGFNQLKAGASQINTQLSETADANGNPTVKAGVYGIKNGIDQLTEVKDGEDASAIDQLVVGAAAVKAGAEQLTDEKNGVPALKKGTETLSKTLKTLATDEKQGIPALKEGTKTLSDTIGTLATDEKQGVPALKSGTKQIADGLGTLNSKMPDFTKGTGDLSTGLNTLKDALPALKDGTSQASTGMSTLLTGLTTLSDSVGTTLKPGLDTLYSGGLTIKSSIGTLNGYTKQIADGLVTADNGAGDLANGIKQLKDEAVTPISDALDDGFDDSMERIKQTVTLADDYDIYSDAADGQDTSVKFVYKTAEIEK